MSSKLNRIYLPSIIIGALLIRIWSVFSTDLYLDNALYAFRALGWYDSLSGAQISPFDFLGQSTWWSVLSFHDAPPLMFLFQHISFIFIGDSLLGARAPFILSGALMTFCIFIGLHKIRGKQSAIIGSLVAAFSSYAVWASYASLLEGISILFITTFLIFFVYIFVEDKKSQKRGLIFSLLSLALALLTKYTCIFLIPPLILFCFLYRSEIKNVLHKKIFLVGCLLLLILSPLIVYNGMLYSLRGHFDIALSSMVGIKSDDFSTLSDRSIDFNIFKNVKEFWLVLYENVSLPLLILFYLSILSLVHRYIKKRDPVDLWFLTNLFSLFIMFMVFAATTRFLQILLPLFFIITALGTSHILEYIDNYKVKIFCVSLLALSFAYEIFYSINTNIVNIPLGKGGIHYSSERIEGLGFHQLEKYLRTTVFPKKILAKSIQSDDDLLYSADEMRGKNIVIYDDRINYFAQTWYLLKYQIYYRLPIIPTTYFLEPGALTFKDLLTTSGKKIYFVYPLHVDVIDGTDPVEKNKREISENLVTIFDKNKYPFDVITNNRGTAVFKIYEIGTLGK